MVKTDEPWTQLATLIPKDLQARLKLHCVTHNMAVTRFVVAAIQEKLGRKMKPRGPCPVSGLRPTSPAR